MLRVTVGLSRKVSKDYNSTGFSVNLDGEVNSPISDAEAVIEEVKQLYDLAEEALAQEIDRYHSDTAIAGRDETRQSHGADTGVPQNGHKPDSNGRGNRQEGQNGNGEAATNKQVAFLLNLGKRQGLTPQQLEQRIENTFGRRIGVYQLTKQEAGQLIDSLNQVSHSNGNGNGRSHG